MFVIIEGEYSDWQALGYVEKEEDAQLICAEHGTRFWCGEKYCDNYDWHYIEVKPFDIVGHDPFVCELIDVSFNSKNELSRIYRLSTFIKEKEPPKVIQEDEYCTVIRLRVEPKISDEKIIKIAKDYLMKYKTKEVE